MLPPPRTSTLFPYTTLFRSIGRVKPGSIGKLLPGIEVRIEEDGDRKSTRLNSSHLGISYAVFCLKKKSYGPVAGWSDPLAHTQRRCGLRHRRADRDDLLRHH